MAANFKEQIKLLKEIISDLRADKANHEKQRQAWEQERRQYENQRLYWEKEKVVLQRENRFIEEEKERLRKKLVNKGLSTQRNIHSRFEIRNGYDNEMRNNLCFVEVSLPIVCNFLSLANNTKTQLTIALSLFCPLSTISYLITIIESKKDYYSSMNQLFILYIDQMFTYYGNG